MLYTSYYTVIASLLLIPEMQIRLLLCLLIKVIIAHLEQQFHQLKGWPGQYVTLLQEIHRYAKKTETKYMDCSYFMSLIGLSLIQLSDGQIHSEWCIEGHLYCHLECIAGIEVA